MTDDTETDTTDEQSPDQLAGWLRDIDNDEITLRLDDGTEADVSVVRSLYLPHSVNTDIGGGSLRHAVRTSEDTAERLGLPSRRGLIAAEERDRGSWTRPRDQLLRPRNRDRRGGRRVRRLRGGRTNRGDRGGRRLTALRRRTTGWQ